MSDSQTATVRIQLGEMTRLLRRCSKELVVADLVYKAIAWVILAPLVGLSFRFLLSFSGRTVLSDVDIPLFFLRPLGWITFVVVGSIWMGILALEQTALMAIIHGGGQGRRVGVRMALQFAWARSRDVLLLIARVVAIVLMTAAPFLLMGGVAFLVLLTEHDINYYLTFKPPRFWVAVGVIGLILIGLVIVLLRLLLGWILALPMVLFDQQSPRAALRESRRQTKGHARLYIGWIGGLLFATAATSFLLTGIVGWLGNLSLGFTSRSLTATTVAVGLVLALATLTNLIVSLFSVVWSAMLLIKFHHRTVVSSAVVSSENDAAWKTLEIPESGIAFRLTPPMATLTILVLVGIAAGVGATAIQGIRLEDTTEVTAHRGSSGVAPENTMAAVHRAIEDGSDWVEIDVQETADGKVVVFHDSDFKKLAGIDLKIWDATTDKLKEIDIGSSFAPEFSNQRVPTLAQVLRTCKGRAAVNIELKYYGHDQQLEQRVIDIVEAHEMEKEVVIMSLKQEAIRKVRSLRPTWRVGVLSAVAIGDLTTIDADFLAVNVKLANDSFIRSAHAKDKQVYVWTVNDPLTMSVMIGRGVDNLITDYPDVARSVLKERAGMSSAERLLLELAYMLGAQSRSR